jgi:hypothetical protein
VHPSVLPAFIDKVSIKEISQCQRIALLEEKLTSFRLEGVDKEDLAEVCQGLEAVDLFLFFRSLIDCDGSTPVTLDDYRALSKKIRLRRSGKDKARLMPNHSASMKRSLYIIDGGPRVLRQYLRSFTR